MLTPEQVLAAQKANIETLFGLTSKAFEGVEKLVELNMQLAKASLGEVTETTKAALSVKDAQELLALQASMLQPSADKAAAYSRHVYDIVANTNSEMAKLAEEQAADMQKKFASAFDAMAKNAPAGSENAVSFFKSTFAAANDAFEQANRAAKEAADVVESNVRQFTKTASKAKPAPKRRHAR